MANTISHIPLEQRSPDAARTHLAPLECGRIGFEIRSPTDLDGAEVHDLVAACPPLDCNSRYANLIQCTHFADTCAIATGQDGAMAWISGHIPPNEPDAFFLWQVAVHPSARGKALPRRMIADILSRPVCRNVQYIKTTITSDNTASWRLFESVARWLDAPMHSADFFDRARHFNGHSESERLVSIGPFKAQPPPT